MEEYSVPSSEFAPHPDPWRCPRSPPQPRSAAPGPQLLTPGPGDWPGGGGISSISSSSGGGEGGAAPSLLPSRPRRPLAPVRQGRPGAPDTQAATEPPPLCLRPAAPQHPPDGRPPDLLPPAVGPGPWGLPFACGGGRRQPARLPRPAAGRPRLVLPRPRPPRGLFAAPCAGQLRSGHGSCPHAKALREVQPGREPARRRQHGPQLQSQAG